MATSNIGKLASLPAEIRIEIWKYLRPQNDEIKTSLNILGTCLQLSSEIPPYIYPQEILTFKLSPKYGRKS